MDNKSRDEQLVILCFGILLFIVGAGLMLYMANSAPAAHRDKSTQVCLGMLSWAVMFTGVIVIRLGRKGLSECDDDTAYDVNRDIDYFNSKTRKTRCLSCGHLNEEMAKFCPECGKPLVPPVSKSNPPAY